MFGLLRLPSLPSECVCLLILVLFLLFVSCYLLRLHSAGRGAWPCGAIWRRLPGLHAELAKVGSNVDALGNARKENDPMKILFLHGSQSVLGGVKPTYFAQHGHE